MTIGSKEHYDILEMFEKSYNHMRLDKESKELWQSGVIYQDGEVNKLYQSFILGYSLGRLVYNNDVQSVAVITSEDDFYHFCSKCYGEVYKKDSYCHTCGSKLKWGKNDVKL